MQSEMFLQNRILYACVFMEIKFLLFLMWSYFMLKYVLFSSRDEIKRFDKLSKVCLVASIEPLIKQMN